MVYGYYYRWRKYRNGLYGKRCRILARFSMNSILVEFEDGVRCVISGNAIAKVKPVNE